MGEICSELGTKMFKWLIDAEYEYMVCVTNKTSPVEKARNEIVDNFLKSDCTHLLFIDSDTVPPQNGIKSLVEANKQIISGLTPIITKTTIGSLNVRDHIRMNAVSVEDKEFNPYFGIQETIAVGSSFILIERSVFDTLKDKNKLPYYEWRYVDDKGNPTIVGEDVNFIIKCREVGIKTYVDTDVVCQHKKAVLW